MSSLSSCEVGEQKITLTRSICDDGTAKLTMQLRARDIALKGFAYFDDSYLLNSVRAFKMMPLDTEENAIISGGYWSDDASHIISEHIHISVVQINKSGDLILTAKVFDPDATLWAKGYGRGGRCDYRLNYDDLRVLSDEMSRLFLGDVDTIEFSQFSDW